MNSATIVTTLIETVQVLTGAWKNIGLVIDAQGEDRLGVWINLVINDTVNARVRALAKRELGGVDEYLLPVRTISASDVKVSPEYIEFNNDIDQKMILGIELDNVIPFVQLQIMAGTVGVNAGRIITAHITRGH